MTEEYQNIDYTDFDEPLCKHGKLLKGLCDYGFEKPSVIQAKCIKPIADGRDLIAQAQSGSGKTGAFVIGSLMKIIISHRNQLPQAVIIANTRELASQIADVTREIGKHMVGLKVTLCVGGIQQMQNRTDQNLSDAISSHILVCTPGRLNGLLSNYDNLLNELKILILDEADQLLSVKFIDQIKTIIKAVSKNAQICLFSATTNSENIKEVKKHFMNNPVELQIEEEKIKVDKIKNYIIDATNESNKYMIMVDLYKNISICQAVIFVNSIDRANYLANKLKDDKHSVGLIHGKLSDFERIDVLKKFRSTKTRILVATDVIARGIDVQQVGLVINYDIPNGEGFMEQYIHRVGRSGRYGKLGVAINILTDNRNEWERIKDIKNKYGVSFSFSPDLQEIAYYLSGINGYNYNENE